MAEGSAYYGLCFWKVVLLFEGGGVTVGVGNEVEAGADVVGFGGAHEFWSGDFLDFSILLVFGGIS